MMNNVALVGRLTKDVEVRKTSSGLSVASFTVACDRRQKDANGQKVADFISCIAWRQSAEFLGQYAKKGALVGVEGRLQSRSYDNQQGQKVYVTEVVANDVSILSSPRGQGAGSPQPSVGAAPVQNAGPELNLDISNDDLPF